MYENKLNPPNKIQIIFQFKIKKNGTCFTTNAKLYFMTDKNT